MSNPNTIIIGAGAAGLAVAACLKQAGSPNIILEQSDKVGATWRRHYERLHLHTDKKNSELPFASYPRDYPRYPSRDQVVKYLEDYAKRFDLDVRFNQQVRSARREEGQWLVQTQDTLHASPTLVVSTGYTRRPLMPALQGLESFRGKLPYGPVTQIRQDKHIPLIDVGTMKLIRGGHIAIYPGVAEVSGSREATRRSSMR